MAKIRGIDVSEHNGTLDWKALKQAGVKFAIIRSGYGKGYTDKQFPNNVAGCEANGIPYGLYHFSYALNTDGVKTECDFVKSLIQKHCKKKPFCVAFDFEYDTVDYAAKQGVTLGKQDFVTHTLMWNKYFGALGYVTPVYINLDYYNRMYDKSKLALYPIWAASYCSTCAIPGYSIWQYSSTTKLSGHSCSFDMNYLDSAFIETGASGSSTATKQDTVDYSPSVASGMQKFKNSTGASLPVYASTLMDNQIGSLNAGEECYCFGKVYSQVSGRWLWAVAYGLDGYSSEWKIGYTDDGGNTNF